MGQETSKAVVAAEDMQLAGVCDINFVGCSFAEIAKVTEGDLQIRDDLGAIIDDVRPDVVVDFTSPASVMGNVRTALSKGVFAVVGTTGITPEDLQEIDVLAKANNTGAIVAPNFAIGAVLMMKFATEAAKHMPTVEIIELHHDKKLDAPSGTAIKTAEMIAAARRPVASGAAQPVSGADEQQAGPVSVVEGINPPRTSGATESSARSEPAARGDTHYGIRIHSVRLPGLVAHQEVIFGGQGQTLTLRHDSLDRSSFMPGVLLAIRRAREVKGLVYGLEKIL